MKDKKIDKKILKLIKHWSFKCKPEKFDGSLSDWKKLKRQEIRDVIKSYSTFMWASMNIPCDWEETDKVYNLLRKFKRDVSVKNWGR